MSWTHEADLIYRDHFTIRPEDVPHCAACGDQGSTEECAAVDCDVRLHPECGHVCVTCKRVVCDEHIDVWSEHPMCPRCQAEVARLELTPEGVAAA
jgi:hypothetical protein